MPAPDRPPDQVYDYLREHVVLQDADHRILWLNRSAAESIASPAAALVGKKCFHVWPARNEPCPACPVSEAHRTGAVCRGEMRTPDGRVWLVTGIPVCGGRSRQDRLIEVALDITELQETKRELAGRTQSLRSLFEDSRDPVYITTRSGRFIAVNQATIDLFGYERDELMALSAAALYCDPQDRARFQAAIDRDGSVKDFPVPLVTKDGRNLSCLLTSSARREGDEIAGYHGIVHDVTRERLFTQSIESALHGTIAALGRTVELRDSYTARHQRRVTALAVRIAERLGFAPDDIECVRVASLMHDIGKLSVPAEILAKPSRLSEGELRIIQEHPQTAHRILSPIPFPWPVATIIIQHHERLDGSGYPRGLRRTAIDPKARVLAVADTVEAMAAHRPYRPALGIDRALEEILAGRGVRFDEDAVDACVALFESDAFHFDETE